MPRPQLPLIQMNSTKKIVDSPDYESNATQASQTAIVLFFLTFLYMAITKEPRPSIGHLFGFGLVGMFAVSLFVAMPCFWLEKRYPGGAGFFKLANVGYSIFLTQEVYGNLFLGDTPIVGP